MKKIKLENKLMLEENNTLNNQPKSDAKPSDKPNNVNNQQNDVKSKNPERNKIIFKFVKWFIVLSLLGVFIFLIWYFSTPHYTRVTPSKTGISYVKEGNRERIIVNALTKDGNGKNLKGDANSLSFEYYLANGTQTVYNGYLQTDEAGKIQFKVKDDVVNADITVQQQTYQVTQHRLILGEFSFWYAIQGNNEFKYDDNTKTWSQVDETSSLNDYWLINFINRGITNSSIPSSFNIGAVLLNILPTIVLVGLFIWYFSKVSKIQGGGEESIWSVGKSQAKLAKSNVKFANVAGLKEEKAELIEIVDYLKNPNKYAAMGARAPKGIILYGPPGTGKTLLAKAVAGEAKVPFFQVTGSSFEDMLVGVGAKRVRDLFNNAKKAAPSIIFIDEFDSVAAKRGKMDIAGGSAGIADQTINQLLAEMDGFNTKSGIVIIAATNRLDVLDSAILRPGRFDRHVQINLPDINEREAILKIHAANKNISSKVNLNDIARRTPGFSGAQLENVLNEATLLAVRLNKNVVTTSEIDEAIDRVIAGPAKHTRVITEAEKKQIAYHEAGHALVGLNIPGSDVIEKITIIPRGQAAGYTLATPEKQELSIQKKSDLLAIICSTLAGRATEEVIYGKDAISTGAANDLYKVTNITRAMVAQLGMTSLGMSQLIPSEGVVNPYSKQFSESTAQKLDSEIEKIIQEQYKRAKDIIVKNKKELDLIVTSLLSLETIVKSQIDYIHKNKKLPAEVIKKTKTRKSC